MEIVHDPQAPWTMLKSRIRILLCLGLACLSVGRTQPPATPDDRIVVGGDQDYRPYEYLDEQGRPTGYNVELTRAIARVMNLNVEVRLGPWGETRQALEEGRIDAIHGMFYSHARDRVADFTPPHTVIHHAIFKHADAPNLDDPEDLEGRRIVVMDGDIMDDWAVAEGLGDDVVRAGTQAEALQRLAAHEADYALVALLPGRYWIRELGLSNIQRTGPLLRPSRYCYAVAEGDEALRSVFAQGLQILKHTGEYERIYDRWLGVLEPEGPSWGDILRVALWIGLPLLLLVAASLGWTWSLRRQVARRSAELESEIVEHAKAQEALKQSEARWRAYIENSPVGIFVADPSGRYVDANPAAARLTGYSRDELLQMHIPDLLPAPTRAEQMRHFETLLAEGCSSGEMSFRHKDGHEFHMLVEAVRLSPDRYIAFCTDTTERRRAEAAVRRSQEMLQAVLDSIPTRVFWKNAELEYQGGNSGFASDAGFDSPDLIVGKTDDDLPWAAQADAIRADDREIMDQDRPRIGIEQSQTLPDGSLRWVWTSKLPLHDHEGRVVGVLGVYEDITERRQAEEERRRLHEHVQQSQKIESLGVMAGGIAHDFNNILMTILGHADLALEEIASTSEAADSLREIERAGRRAADLCQQMLAYSGHGKFVVRNVDLAGLVRDTSELLKATVSKKVDLRFELDGAAPVVDGDVDLLRQVVVNLVTNASEACEDEEGTVVVRTSRRECDAEDLKRAVFADEARPGAFCCLEVTDTGSGLSREVFDRLFEPFFSTRFTGRGLGLAAVQGIVKGHQGVIEIDTEPGQGTSFRVLLPVAEQIDETPTDPAESAEAPAAHGKGTILLVDDEPSIRDLGKRMLERAGFEVVTACDGLEAVEVFEEDPARFAVVVLDLTMPRLDGTETMQRLHALRDDVPVVLSSGYNEQEVTQRFVGEGLAGFIQKPYRSAKLIDTLNEVIG